MLYTPTDRLNVCAGDKTTTTLTFHLVGARLTETLVAFSARSTLLPLLCFVTLSVFSSPAFYSPAFPLLHFGPRVFQSRV